jgi:polyisoprenoid-binding protein YceI
LGATPLFYFTGAKPRTVRRWVAVKPLPESASLVLVVLACVSGAAQAAPRTYRLDPGASLVTVRVGKAGLFSFAGHEHRVRAPDFGGTVVADPDDLAASSIWVRFEAAGLEVSPEGEPAGDPPKVQAVMLGPRVLDTARYAAIRFCSSAVAGRRTGDGHFELEVQGELTLHGAVRPLRAEVRVTLAGPTLTAEGSVVLRQSDWGIKPVSVAGVVKVKDEVHVDYRLVAREAGSEPASPAR